MKNNNSKQENKTTKKAYKKQLEITLKDRVLDIVSTLGLNVELVLNDIEKFSKVAAKKISKNFKPEKKTTVEVAAKTTNKIEKKINKVSTNLKTKPAVASVNVEPIVSVEKVNKVFSAQTPTKKAGKSTPKKTVPNLKPNPIAKKTK
jgi:hypothetical protein